MLSAHELSPVQGSECAEGWNLVTRIAKYHDVTVLYASGSQFAPDAYESAVNNWINKTGNPDNIQFIAVPQPKTTLWLAGINKRISKRNSSIGFPPLYYLGYRLWQKAAYRKALSILEPFDLVHHLTSITFREPGYLWKLPIPFVWGPTGGLEKAPLKFAAKMGLGTLLTEAARTFINSITFSFNGRIRKAIHKSKLIYSFSIHDQKRFHNKGAADVKVMLDAGCLSSGLPVSPVSPVSTSSRLKILWCGQLIKRKALDILLKALAGDPFLEENVEITIIGDGPLYKHYEQLARKLITDNRQPITVTFTGLLARDQVFNYMRSSDVLVHTSYREATSNVIAEALSCGLPVICHDISGMSIAIDESCGIKIPLRSYDESVIGFRNAIKAILLSSRQKSGSELVIGLREGAARRSSHLSWDTMAAQISNDYLEIVAAK